MLSHFGLDHVGLDGAAVVQLVVICDGAASPLLQVQEGVWRLGALWSLANAGHGVCSHVSVDRNELLVTTRAGSKRFDTSGSCETLAGKSEWRWPRRGVGWGKGGCRQAPRNRMGGEGRDRKCSLGSPQPDKNKTKRHKTLLSA